MTDKSSRMHNLLCGYGGDTIYVSEGNNCLSIVVEDGNGAAEVILDKVGVYLLRDYMEHACSLSKDWKEPK